MKIIEVGNCHNCPFVVDDNELGFCRCNLDDDIYSYGLNGLPSDKVHDNCPLKMMQVNVKIKK